MLDLGDQHRDDRGEAVDVGHVHPGVREGAAHRGALFPGDRAAEGDGVVGPQFVRRDVAGDLGDVGADADGAQRRGEPGEQGDAGADEQDPAGGCAEPSSRPARAARYSAPEKR
ncbi:hypothetical protein GCM10010391_71690 [Streptomyces anthocyanicus]|nr:hypothetical protein GCM10010391_71690 [Streptomyces anthocyanicus]